jgi:dolichol-phosphate mannosyltransferase
MKPKILILGASGFVGAGVFEYLTERGFQVFGVSRNTNPWRIPPLIRDKYLSIKNEDVTSILNEIKPNVVVNFAASGAYSFQTDFTNIVNSNLIFLEKIAKWSNENGAYLINAGTSSEYGSNSAGPSENCFPKPNSFYAITKLAGTQLLEFYSTLGLQSVVLRLYSAYGPKEDPSRLMPAVMRGVVKGDWPNFTDPLISRDFIYLDDICSLILQLIESKDKSSNKLFTIYNVGTGIKTTIGDLIKILELEFGMPKVERGNFPKRKWDVEDWYANIDKVSHELDWRPAFDVKAGLLKMRDWYLTADNVKYLNNEYSENQ